MMKDRFIDVGITLHIREWVGEKRPFLLVHGLASNAQTWDGVAHHLAQAGHHVIAVDQRGHGLSDKPDQGYDFNTITADLQRLIQALGLKRPYLAGQSWGGNVLLAFGATYPTLAHSFAFVDGGTIDLQTNHSPDWATIAQQFKPPALTGLPRTTLQQRLQQQQPEWSKQGIEATLANFQTLPDGTIRPWLTLARHMTILRALYEQRPATLYPQLQAPVLLCVATSGSKPTPRQQQQAATAQAGLQQATTQWFPHTAHDIHVHRPHALATLLLRHNARPGKNSPAQPRP